jgi:hypothetical protein
MKLLTIFNYLILTCCVFAEDDRQIPANPPIAKFAELAKESQVIILFSVSNAENVAKYTLQEVIYGNQDYEKNEKAIKQSIPEKPIASKVPYNYEIFYISIVGSPAYISKINSIPILSSHKEIIGKTTFHYNSHSLKDVIKCIKDSINEGKK